MSILSSREKEIYNRIPDLIEEKVQELLIKETHQRLSYLWKDDFGERLDSILEVDLKKRITLHRWFCNSPSGNKAIDINQMLEKHEFLIKIG